MKSDVAKLAFQLQKQPFVISVVFRIAVTKIFARVTGKHQGWSHFIENLQTWGCAFTK